jgi:hypothetical protein
VRQRHLEHGASLVLEMVVGTIKGNPHPQHIDLEPSLSCEAHGVVESDGGERDKRLLDRWKHFGPILQFSWCDFVIFKLSFI